MKSYVLGIYFVWLVTVFVLLTGLYYALPDRYILDYKSISVEYECVNGLQVLHMKSERHPKVTTFGNGEDNIYVYPNDGGGPVRRIEYNNATYRRGTTNDAWDIEMQRPLVAGDYILVGEPQITFFLLTRPIDPITSNVFTVYKCEQNQLS